MVMVLLKLYVMGQVYRMEESLERILGLNRQGRSGGGVEKEKRIENITKIILFIIFSVIKINSKTHRQ